MIRTDRYTKSSFSGGAGCVEARLLSDGTVGLRDSKNPGKTPHVFTQNEWDAFIAGVRAGEFDLPEHA